MKQSLWTFRASTPFLIFRGLHGQDLWTHWYKMFPSGQKFNQHAVANTSAQTPWTTTTKKKCVVENSHSELFLRVYKSVWAYAHVRGRLGEILTCEPWTTRSFPVRFCLDLQTNARTAQPGYTKCVVLFKFRCSEDALDFILYYTEVTLRSRNPLKRSLRVFAPKEHPSFFYGGSPCTASAGGGVTTRARFKQDFLEGLNRS